MSTCRRPRSPYPEEFRANAVKLLRSSGKTIPELSRELGCSTESLRNWSKQADLDAGRRKDGLTSEEREELARLRRENKVLAEEREILKKAAVSSTRQRNVALKRSGRGAVGEGLARTSVEPPRDRIELGLAATTKR